MKVLAIEKELSEVKWNEERAVLTNEAYRVYQLFQEGIIREIYFNQNENAVIVLECESMEDARQVLSTLPLVKEGLISFSVMELHPYKGFNRLIISMLN